MKLYEKLNHSLAKIGFLHYYKLKQTISTKLEQKEHTMLIVIFIFFFSSIASLIIGIFTKLEILLAIASLGTVLGCLIFMFIAAYSDAKSKNKNYLHTTNLLLFRSLNKDKQQLHNFKLSTIEHLSNLEHQVEIISFLEAIIQNYVGKNLGNFSAYSRIEEYIAQLKILFAKKEYREAFNTLEETYEQLEILIKEQEYAQHILTINEKVSEHKSIHVSHNDLKQHVHQESDNKEMSIGQSIKGQL